MEDKVKCTIKFDNMLTIHYNNKNYIVLEEEISANDIGEWVGYIYQNVSGVMFATVYLDKENEGMINVAADNLFYRAVEADKMTAEQKVLVLSDVPSVSRDGGQQKILINTENVTQLIYLDQVYQVTERLQDTISKCKTLLKEQVQVIAQKDMKISQLEKSCREKDAVYARLLQQKEEQKERLERKIESERSSYRYLNSRLRETEEELADVKEQLPWWKKKRKKKSKLCYYKKHWWQSDKFKANVVMGIILAGYICVVWWLFKWSLGW